MRADLSIETFDRALGREILGTPDESRGAIVHAPGGVDVEFEGTLVRKAVGFAPILEFALHIGEEVVVGVFAAWLYDKLKGSKIEKITINKTVIAVITETAIRHELEKAAGSGIDAGDQPPRLD
jgi:hypothetical protein